MYRVITDEITGIKYVQKKFLFLWLDYAMVMTNTALTTRHVFAQMSRGRYRLGTTSFTWPSTQRHGNYTTRNYRCPEDYKQEHIEDFI